MTQLSRGSFSLYFEALGSGGPPVLFIQGCGVGAGGWQPQTNVLAANYRVAAFDNRGYGRSGASNDISVRSMTDDAVALMDELGWDSAHVVGHSLGGVIAQQLALDLPNRVRSLSLLCTFVRGRDGAKVSAWMLWKAICQRVGSRASRRRAFLDMVMPPSAAPSQRSDEFAVELGKLFGRDLADQPAIILKQVRALGAHDASRELGRLGPIPTLVVSASLDRVAPVAQGRALAKAIPGARYEEIADAAHGVTIQRASDVNALLTAHFDAAERHA
ncbi:MAG: alpha/beta hydrolase [Polyangiaceae bacterium]